MKRSLRVQGYVRYVDDLLLFADDKADLWRWRETVVARLAALRLTIHPGAHPRPVAEGIPFLGFVVFPWCRRLKRRKAVDFGRRLRRLALAVAGGDAPASHMTACVQGWVNHAHHGNTVGLRKSMLRQAIRPPTQGRTAAVSAVDGRCRRC